MALCTTVAAVLWLRPVGRRFLRPCTGALSALAAGSVAPPPPHLVRSRLRQAKVYR